MYIGPVNSNNFNFNILKQDMQQFLEDQTAFVFQFMLSRIQNISWMKRLYAMLTPCTFHRTVTLNSLIFFISLFYRKQKIER